MKNAVIAAKGIHVLFPVPLICKEQHTAATSMSVFQHQLQPSARISSCGKPASKESGMGSRRCFPMESQGQREAEGRTEHSGPILG